jgi:hypothetical protein
MAQLPVIDTATEAQIRSKEEIAYRALCLLTVALKGEGLEQSIVERIVQEHDLVSRLTLKESAFIANLSPSIHERTQFSWRYECAWVLLWALSFVEELGRPDQICDVSRSVRFMKERTTSEFLADSKERPAAEILDAADLIYRYDWACVSARLKGEPAPAGLDKGIVQERHHALNWLFGYLGQEWDRITIDT